MKLLFFFLAAIAAAQTPAAVADAKLPAYVAGGIARNQLAGTNFFATGVVPVSNTLGLYESTTTDLFPARFVVAGRSAYLFTTSVREGLHKVVFRDSKNMILFGADAGFSLAQASASGSVSAGVSGAVTFTYVRQLSTSFALMVPVRALYLSQFGAWNPVVEFGFVWKPGAK